jgi:hypothetical protein
MAHLSAIDTAADIERIRQALSPDDGLVAYAGSYGTVYGAAYLERYGEHIKALVLDAVVDHSIDLATMVARNILSVTDAFDRFAQWRGRDRACVLHGQDLGNVFDAVAVTAPVTRTLVPQLLSAGRDPQLGWPALAQMLAEASRGDTSTLDKLTEAAPLGSSAADHGSPPGLPVYKRVCSARILGRSVTMLLCSLLALPSPGGRPASPGGSGMQRRLRIARRGWEIASVGPPQPPIRPIAFRLDRILTSWWQTALTIRRHR